MRQKCCSAQLQTGPADRVLSSRYALAGLQSTAGAAVAELQGDQREVHRSGDHHDRADSRASGEEDAVEALVQELGRDLAALDDRAASGTDQSPASVVSSIVAGL